VKILVDEMYPATVAGELHAARIEATTVADLRLGGASDPEVFGAAVAGGYTVLTENVGDFARIAAGRAVLGSDSREVANVLGEHGVAAGDSSTEHFWVRRAGESKLSDRGGLDPRRLKRFGDSDRVHLVDEDLHRASAAAVSLRWSSILAWISSGYTAR